MAGDTIVRFQQIISDLRQSWYFRVWAFAWLTLALVTFSALIILSQESNRAKEEHNIVMWVENSSQIQFPRFHFRMDPRGNEVFQSPLVCIFGSNANQFVLVTQPCQSFFGFQPPLNQCIAFNSNEYTALNDWTRGDQRITCELYTQGQGYFGNQMIAFEFEGEQNFGGKGAQPFMSTWFAPNDMNWITLQKKMFFNKPNAIQLKIFGIPI